MINKSRLCCWWASFIGIHKFMRLTFLHEVKKGSARRFFKLSTLTNIVVKHFIFLIIEGRIKNNEVAVGNHWILFLLAIRLISPVRASTDFLKFPYKFFFPSFCSSIVCMNCYVEWVFFPSCDSFELRAMLDNSILMLFIYLCSYSI